MSAKTVPSIRGLTSTRRQLLAGSLCAVAGAAIYPAAATTDSHDEISHSAESIHQERLFNAGPKRIYEALTVTPQFDKIIQLTGVMRSPALATMQKPTDINPAVGGAFTLFGGYITGRQIELLPNELIVQAWRVGSWSRGRYSIARFELVAEGTRTRIVFDHTGFPKGRAEELASGWQEHYWDPLAKFLS
jgi:activator of HSP90 ATPase